MMKRTGGDPRKVEQELGIEPPGIWGDGPVHQVDIPNPRDRNLRIASGDEGGANEKWIAGGKTSGDVDEAVIDPVPWSDVDKYNR